MTWSNLSQIIESCIFLFRKVVFIFVMQYPEATENKTPNNTSTGLGVQESVPLTKEDDGLPIRVSRYKQVVTKSIYLKLSATTSRERHFRNERNKCTISCQFQRKAEHGLLFFPPPFFFSLHTATKQLCLSR
jgi:hypothetical protein